MKLLHDYVLLEQEDAKETNVGGIIVTTQPKQEEGVVVAVGDGTFNHGKWISPNVEVGDRVRFNGFTNIEIEGKKYLLLRYSDIICVL